MAKAAARGGKLLEGGAATNHETLLSDEHLTSLGATLGTVGNAC